LSEWGTKPITSPYRDYLPWLSDADYSKIFSLTQIVNFLYLRKRLRLHRRQTRINIKFNVLYFLSNLLMPFVTLRLKNKFFRLPVEWKLYYLIKKKLLHMDL